MKFDELLIASIQRSEIPLRFEPGAEEAVARPVIEMLQAWIASLRSRIRNSMPAIAPWLFNSSPSWTAPRTFPNRPALS
jgi:hypothetical protein